MINGLIHILLKLYTHTINEWVWQASGTNHLLSNPIIAHPRSLSVSKRDVTGLHSTGVTWSVCVCV